VISMHFAKWLGFLHGNFARVMLMGD